MSLEDNNKSNSFFSVFNSGGGGGSSSVTTASNVGTGIGLFKAKVLEDLEFKTLLEGKGINISANVSGNEVDVELSTNVVGIADGTGWYTFYNSVSDAISNATAGDTITFFTDIVESSSVSLLLNDSITFDLNGFSYTLDVADSTNMFATPLDSVRVKFMNGALYRINAVQTLSTNGLIFRFNNYFELTFDNSFIISNDDSAIINCNESGSTGKVYGGIWIGGNPTLGWAVDSKATFNNSVFFSEALLINSGYLNNCIVYLSNLVSGDAIISAGGEISNCYINGLNGVVMSGETQLNNCVVVASDIAINSTSTSFVGGGIINNCSIIGGENAVILSSSSEGTIKCKMVNSFIKSNRFPALQTTQSVISNCHIETDYGDSGSPQYAILDLGGNQISNCSIYNYHLDSLARGIKINGNQSKIVNNTITMGISSSIAITGTSSNNVYLSSNVGVGCFTLVDTTNLTNIQANTPDLYGNILIG